MIAITTSSSMSVKAVRECLAGRKEAEHPLSGAAQLKKNQLFFIGGGN
jgi:type IV secretory pathway VirB6-like protein